MDKQSNLNIFFPLVKLLLAPFSILYGAMIWLRNRLYDTGFYSSVQFDRPTITVGNLSAGGTGKTPHVEYLIRLLQYRYKVATMSRGYKRRTQGFILADENTNALRIGDEPMQYVMKYPDVAVSVAEERMTGIPYLLSRRPETEVILLDDAFQHRSVHPHINIMITDIAHPFYKDHILPYGRLRESRSAYKRADVIIVSKCPPSLREADADTIIKNIHPFEHQQVFFSSINYGRPYDLFSRAAVDIAGKNVILVCGIAKPGPMEAFVRKYANDVHLLSYPDHHYFLSRDLEEIQAADKNWNLSNKIILTTEKDAARLWLQAEKLSEWKIPIVVLPIEISIMFGKQAAFDAYIESEVARILHENFPPPENPVEVEIPSA